MAARARALVWIAALAAVAGLQLAANAGADWLAEVPRGWQVPLDDWIGGATNWLMREAHFGLFTFADLTRAIAAAVAVPYDAVTALLTGGAALPWVAVTGLVVILGLWAGGWWTAMLAGGAFLFVAVTGQWGSAMLTLASILIAVPVAAAGGLALGLVAHRSRGFARALSPVLDLMQTMPVFAYLVPILILFGFSPVAAIIATVIFALPPMTRVTMLALDRVPGDIRDLGRMTGCTRRQMTWRVMIPSAREGLMVGLNQVIMLSLNMVIIASMIGAGGLGFDVLTALRQLDFDKGVTAGLAIVALAVALDRLSEGAARRTGAGGPARNGYLLAALAMLAVTFAAATLLPAAREWPAAAMLSSGDFWARQIEYVNTTWFETIDAIKTFALMHILVPVKRFLTGLPWPGVVALVALAGWRLGGWRLGLLTGALALFVALTGLWEEAMITVYLCGVSTLVAMAIGVPLGIAAAEWRPLWPPLRAAVDTLQTLPSFVYLMPAVMLFRVGDFTAMLAVVAFAVAPAIRYTATGLMAVDPALVEAGRAMGCTRWQLLTRIKLRLAAPEILLGLNQTVMFALSMLVITALVGTRDLGQEVYIALTKADAGAGLVAGLCVAAIAIIADRLIQAGAGRLRASLGLGGTHGS